MATWRQMIDTAKQNGEWEQLKADARKIDSELKADPLKYNSLFLRNRVEALAGKDATLWDFERVLIRGMNDSQKTVLLEIITECKTIIQKSQTGNISGSNIMAVSYLNCIEAYYPDLLTERTQPHTERAENTPRTIDAEGLKEYFKPAFNGVGHCVNYFDWLIDHLKTTPRTAKDFKRIALMIYESPNALNNKKPTKFAQWYRIFCKCVGCQTADYKPNALKPYPQNLANLFNYL
ncbi:MAG: hypothetical protein LBR50_02925 [Tannerella sp.]|jgi:hypothetical protein|nr:hypothetical protein [Tannerella sp.]